MFDSEGRRRKAQGEACVPYLPLVKEPTEADPAGASQIFFHIGGTSVNSKSNNS
jgi:hypothetical protein